MKNKILSIVFVVLFILALIILSVFLNKQNENKLEIGNVEESNMEVLNVTSANFEKEVLSSDKTVIIDFYADWCGPCKMFSPIIESVAAENEDVKVVKIDVDKAQDLAIAYQVMSIPTIVIVKDGKEVNRNVGIASKSQILEMVK